MQLLYPTNSIPLLHTNTPTYYVTAYTVIAVVSGLATGWILLHLFESPKPTMLFNDEAFWAVSEFDVVFEGSEAAVQKKLDESIHDSINKSLHDRSIHGQLSDETKDNLKVVVVM